jgi:hypothetical protein
MVGVSRESGVHRIVVDNSRLCLVSDAGEYLIKKRKGCFTRNLRQQIGIYNMKILDFSIFVGNFFPPGSGSVSSYSN